MFTLTIETDNEAFVEHEQAEGCEIARILRHAATLVEQGFLAEPHVLDSNGTTVGSWCIS